MSTIWNTVSYLSAKITLLEKLTVPRLVTIFPTFVELRSYPEQNECSQTLSSVLYRYFIFKAFFTKERRTHYVKTTSVCACARARARVYVCARAWVCVCVCACSWPSVSIWNFCRIFCWNSVWQFLTKFVQQTYIMGKSYLTEGDDKSVPAVFTDGDRFSWNLAQEVSVIPLSVPNFCYNRRIESHNLPKGVNEFTV